VFELGVVKAKRRKERVLVTSLVLRIIIGEMFYQIMMV
jgi:hypothetical protein